ncbi:MAG TPA: STAS domain-containing protein [Capillimicrobium sp.]|jgi:anti-anti-sigma factor
MQTPDFEIHVEDDGDLLVLAPRGELDLLTVPRVHEAIERHCTGRSALVVDLSGLSFMDSTGIRLLVALHNRRDGTNVAFVAPSGPAALPLEVAGLREVFGWVEHPRDALGEQP